MPVISNRLRGRWLPCPRCPRVPGRRPVAPSGPRPSRVLLVGEGPAKNEDRLGRPFVGATGQELDRYYLPVSGVQRRLVAVCNAHMCSMPRYNNPDPADAAVCADYHFHSVLDDYQPEIIVAMGAVACSIFEPKIDLQTRHGIPLVGWYRRPSTSERLWTGVILPLYHPAAGMRDALMALHLQEDFPILKRVLNEGLSEHWIRDRVKPDYKMVGDRVMFGEGEPLGKGKRRMEWETLDEALKLCDSGRIAIDTEVDTVGPELDPWRDEPYMLSFSGRPGMGRVMLAGDGAIAEFNEWINRTRPEVVIHNSLFDMPILRRMGVDVPWERVRDSMVEAYHTYRLPQGLKQLAWRRLGAKMSDFEDVVRPWAAKVQLQYLIKMAYMDAEKFDHSFCRKGQWKIPRLAQAAVDGVINKGADPQDRWRNWDDKYHQAMEEGMGAKFPYRSIRFVPLAESSWYAAEDAAMTYRLLPEIRSEAVKIRRVVR